MKINYDKVADAIYITIKGGKVDSTKVISQSLNADLDSSGDVIGFEILSASSNSKQAAELEKNILNGVPVNITEQTPVMV